MSLLGVGTKCASCTTVDFLPSICDTCALTFCSTHIRNHPPCTSTTVDGQVETNALAGPSSFKTRSKCWHTPCDRVSIEGLGGFEGDDDTGGIKGEHRAGEGGVAREVRCPACAGSYCVQHRAQVNHECSGPLLHNVRHDASVVRKANAQAVLAKHFPDQAGKVVPKPPPGRDVERRPPIKEQALPPLLQPVPPVTAPTIENVAKKGKSREEKLWDIHVRKIRSLATPLPGTRAAGVRDDEKRFFEWGSGAIDAVQKWEADGKWTGKVERSWVKQDTPIGRLLDLVMTASKTARPSDPGDPYQTLSLILLSTLPDTPKKVTPLDLSRSVGEQVHDGALVVLVKGWVA